MHKGLTREKIVLAAIEVLKKNDFKDFSLRMLAESLDVKAASLYKHFKSMDELTIAVALKVYEEFEALEQEAVSNAKTRQEAVMALAMAYKDFAYAHVSFYQLLLVLPKVDDEEMKHITDKIFAPVQRIIKLYNMDSESNAHWTYIYMATIVGFMVGRGSGVASCFVVTPTASFRLAIRNIISALESIERAQLARANDLIN